MVERELALSSDSSGELTRQSAFTLIELLVVVAIVAMLAGLILPTLIKSKEKSRGAECMNNNRQMMIGMQMYASDFANWLPPNPDGGAELSWVRGTMTKVNEATNTLFLTRADHALLAPYTGHSASVYKCPSDPGKVYDRGQVFPKVRSYAMNQGVGTIPGEKRAVDGPWMDGYHSHQANQPYQTYGKLSDVVEPAPSDLWVLVDEHHLRINDAAFAVSMAVDRWVDWVATYHHNGAGFGFIDGHGEMHRWLDPGGTDVKKACGPFPDDKRDLRWLQQRSSALAR